MKFVITCLWIFVIFLVIIVPFSIIHEEKTLEEYTSKCNIKGGVVAEWTVREGKHSSVKRSCVNPEMILEVK